MIKAFQKNETLWADIEAYESMAGFKVWWIGQSGFILKWQNKTILFDPYLSDSLTKKYANTDKPHTRISELCLDPNLIQNLTIVFSSHNHTDHLDAETLQPILKNNPTICFVIPEANRDFVCERVGCAIDFPIGLNDKQTFEYKDFTITALPAAHNTIERDNAGRCKFLSYIVQFGNYAVYHSGDTLWYDELEEHLKSYNLDLAFLPINGNKPERKVAGNLNFAEAAALAKAAKIETTIPHHYDLFEFNTEDPFAFENIAKLLNINYKILKIGEGFEIFK